MAIKLGLLLLVAFCLAGIFSDVWLQTDSRMWQHDSEALVVGRVYQMQTGVENPAGLMGGYDGGGAAWTEQLFLTDTPSDAYHIYWHGIGLQGTLCGWLNRILCLLRLSPLARLSTLYFVTIWSFFAVMGAICLWLYREFGWFATLLAGVGTVFSSWSLRSIGNLYWVTALYLLPFALCAYVCRRYENSRAVPWQACLLIVGGVFLRFLCGFEFVSTVLICMETPMMYYWFKHRKESKKWFRAALYTGLFGVAAFAVTFVIWLVQMRVGFGSWKLAYEEMLYPVVLRTGFFKGAMEVTGVFAESLSVPLTELFRIYLQDSPILCGMTMQTVLLIYTVVLAATLAFCALRKEKALLRRNVQLLGMCAIALLAPASWLVLGRGHAAIHTHIDYILWLFPLLPCLLGHVGFCLQTWRESLTR